MSRAAIRRKALVLGTLTFLLLVGGAAASELAEALSGLRLSGVILLKGEPTLAVIEQRGGKAQTVRVGEKLPGVGMVAAIGPDWIRVQTGGAEETLHLSSAPSDAVPASKAPAAAPAKDPTSPRHYAPVTVTPEISQVIQRVAADRTANLDDLGLALIPLLDLPGDARLKAFPGGPEGEDLGPAGVSEALARGQPVRLLIDQGGQEQIFYLMPQQLGRPAVGGPAH